MSFEILTCILHSEGTVGETCKDHNFTAPPAKVTPGKGPANPEDTGEEGGMMEDTYEVSCASQNEENQDRGGPAEAENEGQMEDMYEDTSADRQTKVWSPYKVLALPYNIVIVIFKSIKPRLFLAKLFSLF